MRTFVLDIRGEFACFSMPVPYPERYSYPCPTPSAARGIFDSIFVKPEQFRWQIERVEILHDVSYIPLRRNEVKDTVNVTAVQKWMSDRAPIEPIFADGDKALLRTDEKGRTQRQTMALRDVRYRLHANIKPWPGRESDAASYESQFLRRARVGKCFMQPCLGQREMIGFFRLAEDCADQPPPVGFDQDLGWMLYDVFNLSRPGTNSDPPCISLFRAKIERGVLDVPPYGDPKVRKAVFETNTREAT
jgi:CRISPR-associated protein Cas5d